MTFIPNVCSNVCIFFDLMEQAFDVINLSHAYTKHKLEA